MKQFVAASLGLVSSKISTDLSSITNLEDPVLDINGEQTNPELGYTVSSGACIKLRDNSNIFDLKLLERGASAD